MPRRTFLQAIFSLPALSLLRPRRAPVVAPAPAGLTYSDSIGTTDFSGFSSGIGILYGA